MPPSTTLDADHAAFIAAQPMYFVATAPLAGDGHVNLSPKGLDTFRVLGPTEVAYLDLTGSGNETAAHVYENGRVTILFCAFAGQPKILRLYGRGRVNLPGDERWAELRSLFPDLPGIRQVFTIELDRVQYSCGFGVPLLERQRDRDNLPRWAENKGEAGLAQYRETKNARSIDGLPAPGLGALRSGG